MSLRVIAATAETFSGAAVPLELPCDIWYLLMIQLVDPCRRPVADTPVTIRVTGSSIQRQTVRTDLNGYARFEIVHSVGESVTSWQVENPLPLEWMYGQPALVQGALVPAYATVDGPWRINVALWNINTLKSARGVPQQKDLEGIDCEKRLDFLINAVQAAFRGMDLKKQDCAIFLAPEYYFLDGSPERHFVSKKTKDKIVDTLKKEFGKYGQALIVAGTIGWVEPTDSLPDYRQAMARRPTIQRPPESVCSYVPGCRSKVACKGLHQCEEKGREERRCPSMDQCRTATRCEEWFSCAEHAKTGKRCAKHDLPLPDGAQKDPTADDYEPPDFTFDCLRATGCGSTDRCTYVSQDCGKREACEVARRGCLSLAVCKHAEGAKAEFAEHVNAARGSTADSWQLRTTRLVGRSDLFLVHNTALVFNCGVFSEIDKRFESFSSATDSDDVPDYAGKGLVFSPGVTDPTFSYHGMRMGLEICADYIHASLASFRVDNHIQLLCSATFDCGGTTAVKPGGFLIQADAKGPHILPAASDMGTIRGNFPGTISAFRVVVER